MSDIISYVPDPDPHKWKRTLRLPDVHSEWKGLERLFPELLVRFNVTPGYALEFGVWYGFSTAVLANFFRGVTGVDTFTGDAHAGFRENLREDAERALFPFSNIQLVEMDYRAYIEQPHDTWDLIHIDILHDYAPTLELGTWAVAHARCVIAHDTEAFPEVKRALGDIARATGCEFHNYPECHGLGILVRK